MLFFLFLFILPSKKETLFLYLIQIILLSPLYFYSLKDIGFRNLKKGFYIGTLSSIPLLVISGLKNIPLEVNFFLYPILEEIFFRGFLFKEVKIKNIHIKNVFISLLFALAHFLLFGDIFKLTVFFPSLIFGYLYIYSNSLIAPIIFHIASNIFFISFLYPILEKSIGL